MYEIEIGQVRTEAQMERDRIDRQAEQARQEARDEAARLRARVAEEVRSAAERAEREAEIVKQEATKQAEIEKDKVRQLQSVAEREAEAVKAQAREAQSRELRKLDLPITRPRKLGMQGYIQKVETARREAHKTGKEARVGITEARDDYFKKVDEVKNKALQEIAEQQKGAEAGISERLVEAEAEIIKQVASLNSGIDEWEAESISKIAEAEKQYQQAIKDLLNRPGEEVFADLQKSGFIPAKAVYESYDNITGEVTYTIPDLRSGEEIFKDMKEQGILPPNAVYKGYDKETGQIEYRLSHFVYGEEKEDIVKVPTSQTQVNSGLALAGAVALTPAIEGVAWGMVAAPEPISTIIGALIIVGIGVATYFSAKRLKEMGASEKAIEQAEKSQKAGASIGASDIIVVGDKGLSPYTLQQIQKKSITTGFPLEIPKPSLTITPLEQAKSLDTTFPLMQEMWQPEGVPRVKEKPLVITRFPLDTDPTLQGKASNILVAALSVTQAVENFQGVATRELGVSRSQFSRTFTQINEQLRQGNVAAGRQILETMGRRRARAYWGAYERARGYVHYPTRRRGRVAEEVSISKSLNAAFEAYLRKKAILDAARKAYIASLNPQPVKGKGSNKANAAAIGVWFVIDILRDNLRKGKSLEAALKAIQPQVEKVAKVMELTQSQIKSAIATVIYEVALQNMVRMAIQVATQTQAQAMTQVQVKAEVQIQVQTAVQQALKTQVQTITQQAVAAKALTKAQARTLTRVLTVVAEAVAVNVATLRLPAEITTTIKPPKIKLPEIKEEEASGKKEYPAGTIVFKMGELKQGDEWKIIPPPYDLKKPISSRTPPIGVKRLDGTPQQTLTFIGGKLPFSDVSFDLGVVDGFIDVSKRKIIFKGEGERTDVGLRLPSPTKGIALRDVSRIKAFPKKKRKPKRKSNRKEMKTVSVKR